MRDYLNKSNVVAAFLCILLACCFSTAMAKDSAGTFVIKTDELSADTIACLAVANDNLSFPDSGSNELLDVQECEIACAVQRHQCVQAGINPQLCLNFFKCCMLDCYGLDCQVDDFP